MRLFDFLDSYTRLCDKGIQARRACDYSMAIDFFQQAMKKNQRRLALMAV